MTPAELRTAHDSLGVSSPFLAKRAGVHVNMLWRYESPERTTSVSAAVEDAVRDMLNDREAAVERIVQEAEGWAYLPRFADDAAADREVPELAGWGATAHGLLYAEVQARTGLEIRWA